MWIRERDHTAISDKSFKQLKALENLEYLNIVGTNSTAKGLQTLMQQPNLKMIYLKGTKITAEERVALEALQSNAKLYFGDSMKSAITDTLFTKKAE